MMISIVRFNKPTYPNKSPSGTITAASAPLASSSAKLIDSVCRQVLSHIISALIFLSRANQRCIREESA